MYLRLNTGFNPFTYDEMVKPLVQYKQAYDATEAAYSDLSTRTDQWRDAIDEVNNPEASRRMRSYSEDLTNVVNDFSKGMTAQNRGKLLEMRRRYAKDVLPIENAYKRKMALMDEQRRATIQNPSLLWQRDANDLSIDELVANPSADYGKSYSGAALTAQVADSAAALAKDFKEDQERARRVLGGDYYEYIRRRGFSKEAVLAAIMDSNNASPILSKIVEDAVDSSGIKEWGSDTALQRAYDFAKQGLWSSVGSEEAQLIQNWREVQSLKNAGRRSSGTTTSGRLTGTKKLIAEATPILDDAGEATDLLYNPKIGIIDYEGNVITPKDKWARQSMGMTEGNLKMKPIYFDAFLNDTSRGLTYKKDNSNDFDMDDAVLIYSGGKPIVGAPVPNTLSSKALTKIISKLPKGVSLNDVDIYVDHDSLSDSHYVVVDKNFDLLGNPKQKIQREDRSRNAGL